MLIRSQDKESIANLNNIESLDIHKYRVGERKAYADDENPNTFYIGYVGLSSEICWLGRYSTKLKAINTLDRIAEECMEEYRYFQMPQDGDV